MCFHLVCVYGQDNSDENYAFNKIKVIKVNKIHLLSRAIQ